MKLNKQESYGLLVAALVTARPDVAHERIVGVASVLQREARILARKPAALTDAGTRRRETAKRRIAGDNAATFGYVAEFTPDSYTVLHFPANAGRPAFNVLISVR